MKQHVFKSFTTMILMVFGLCLTQAYAFDSTVNLAVGKPAVARDSRSFDGYGSNPAFVTDNDMNSHWCAQWDAAGMGSWIYIDLQNYYLVNKVVIAWRGNRWPNGAWKIQVATNEPDASGNSNWVDAYVGNAGTDTDAGTGTYVFTSTAGRYVRMLGIAQSTGYGYNIYEMRAYASDYATPQGGANAIAISPSSKTLMVNQTYQFQSSILAQNGIPLDVTYTPSWTIQEPSSGASINGISGLFRATQTGTYTIACSTTYESSPFNASATVTVIPFDANQNLALNKTATTSGQTASNGNDGNLDSRWRSSNANQHEWWQVDLGTDYVINNVTIKMNGDGGARGATYNILVSLTGLDGSWQTVVTSAQIPAGSGQEYNSHALASVPARYVKYDGLTRGGWDHNFAEFEVHGTGFYHATATATFTSVLFNNANVIANEEAALTITALDEESSPYLNATITGLEITEGNASGVTFEKRSDVWYARGLTQGTYTLRATGVDNTDGSIVKTGTATFTVTEARRVATINLTSPSAFTKYATNRPYDLSVSCVDQYGAAINPTIIWDIQGTAGGSVTNNKYTPANKGTGTVKATSTTSAGTVQSTPITFDVITEGANITLNKPVSSISTATTDGSNAVDANIGTQWIVPDVTGANNVYDAWITIDLQANYLIELIDVIWEGAYSKTYTVDYSTNGVDFTTKYNGSNNGGTVTKYNQFYANPSTARFVRIHSTEAGSGYGTKILDVYIHGVDASVTNHFRTVGSGNWNDISTWETSTDNVNWVPATVFPTTYANSIEILNGKTVTLTENLKASTLNINGGGKLTLNSGKTLEATAINIQSDPTNGTGTYVDKGTTKITSASVQQYITAGRNWYISCPLGSALSGVVTGTAGNRLWKYDELNTGNVQWNPVTSTDVSLNMMTGYIANTISNGLITFSGDTLNTGNKSILLNRTENGKASRGYNLVGNPYPSYLDWTAARANSSNLGSTMWYRTKTTGYIFATYNASGGQYTNQATQFIPPMQAFWVYVNASGNGSSTTGTLSVTNDMRSHESGSNRLKSPSYRNTAQQVLRLKVSNGTNDDETVVYFDSNAANGFDSYDSQKMSNGNPVPDIYTVVESQNLAINGMTSINPNQEIALGFKTDASNTFTIEATEVRNFDASTKIILKDNLLHSEQEITEGTSYSFISDPVASTSRFSIIFKSGSITTELKSSNNDNEVSVFKNAAGQMVVKCTTDILTPCANISVYNSIGLKLENKLLTSTTTVLSELYPSGVYFVNVQAKGKTTTKKVVVN